MLFRNIFCIWKKLNIFSQGYQKERKLKENTDMTKGKIKTKIALVMCRNRPKHKSNFKSTHFNTHKLLYSNWKK